MRARPVVLLLVKGLGIGGAETLIAKGARFWDRRAFEYHVAYVLPWKDQLVPELEAVQVPVHLVGGPSGFDPMTLRRFRRLASGVRADLVHAHLPLTGVMARLASPAPVVYTEHNLAHSYRLPTRIANFLTYRRNAEVLAVSQAVADSLRRYGGPPPVVVPNGVWVEVRPEEAATARKELGLEAGQELVVHVGNIRPHKGHSTLIRAAAILRRSHPGAMVVSIGGEKHAGDLDRLQAETESAGAAEGLRFLGRREDALAFVAAADVFVNPADVEGLPLAVLEAMALGRPVVATRVGGVPSVVQHGRTGLLCEPGDAVGLARATASLLDDLAYAEQLGKAGRAVVEERHGLEAMIRAIEDRYRRVLLD